MARAACSDACVPFPRCLAVGVDGEDHIRDSEALGGRELSMTGLGGAGLGEETPSSSWERFIPI